MCDFISFDLQNHDHKFCTVWINLALFVYWVSDTCATITKSGNISTLKRIIGLVKMRILFKEHLKLYNSLYYEICMKL